MLFCEFAVNDDQDSDQAYHDALRGMEGIIAQARKHNPKVDIVMTMFVNENILEKLQKGRPRTRSRRIARWPSTTASRSTTSPRSWLI